MGMSRVRVGVFPEREEIMICGLGLGGVALHGVGSADLELCQWLRYGQDFDVMLSEAIIGGPFLPPHISAPQ
jgi:hypothetical protein